MNHEEKKTDLQTWIEPELEARVVAAMLGEASPFETAELDRLAGEKPELVIFKRRLEAVHGLVGLALSPEQAPMRLAADRRAKILQTIGATPARQQTGDKNSLILLELAEARRKRRRRRILTYSLAASLPFAAILAVVLAPSSKYRYGTRQLSETAIVALPVAEDALRSERARRAVVMKSEAKARNQKKSEETQTEESAQSAPIIFNAVQLPDGNKERDIAPFGSGAPAGVLGGSDATQGTNSGEYYFSKTSARADMRDVGGAISVVTPQFLQDSGGTNSINGFQRGYIGEPGKPSNYAASGSHFVAPASQPNLAVADASTDGEIIRLSPLEVTASMDRGFAASNTLAGTRLQPSLTQPTAGLVGNFGSLKTKGSGLAGSISAVTKQTFNAPAFDLNDGFLSASSTGSAKDFTEIKASPAPSPAAEDAQLSREKESAAPPSQSQSDSTRDEINARQQAVSTFSLHVSDVSFRLAQAALARGENPDPERIRPEEFYNAFNYGDPAPTATEKISCHIEQSAHPFLQQRNLVRIAMKVAASGRGASQPLNLTVLLDTSGSMEREDRISSVHRALEVLASLLHPADRVTLIGFARQPRLLVEQLPGDQAAKLADLASHTPFTGGTNMEEALKLAGELARRHRDPAAQNRIVLLTDGAANLGSADPAQLAAMIEMLRQQGVAFDACGVGTDGLDDAILEALTRKGDGRYYVLDKPEDADAGFARQLAGAFRPAAENVKVQVRFNPARVGSYRLIGFEQHRLREEDFRNDKVDAAELAADEAAVALYQVEVLPQGEGELGDVFVRFRDAATGKMIERSWTMLDDPHARTFDRATPTLQLAGTAALIAEKLRGGAMANAIDLAQLAPVVNGLRGQYANDARVQELIAMFEQMRRRTEK